MYEFDYIEVEDNGLNHYIHHFDECEDDLIHFNEELGCIEEQACCVEEIYWS